MTKQTPDEISVKCQINLDEVDKVRSRVAGVLDKNALAIRSAKIRPEDEIERKVEVVMVQKKTCQTELGRIMSKLYDVETGVEREKPSKIDLDLELYQMEDP